MADAPNLPRVPGRKSLAVAVDADRQRDRVSIRYAPRAPSQCGFVLLVRTAKTHLALRVPEEYKSGVSYTAGDWVRQFREPRLVLSARLWPRRSAVLVATARGASVELSKLVWLDRGRLAHRDVSYYGSVSTNRTIDCDGRARGRVAVTSVVPARATSAWEFARVVYRIDGARWNVVRTQRARVAANRAASLSRRFKLGRPPFSTCTDARGT